MPKGADVHGLANSGHGHTGAQRRASLHAQGVGCDTQNAQAPLNPQKKKTENLRENLPRELHTRTAPEYSDFCEHQNAQDTSSVPSGFALRELQEFSKSEKTQPGSEASPYRIHNCE